MTERLNEDGLRRNPATAVRWMAHRLLVAGAIGGAVTAAGIVGLVTTMNPYIALSLIGGGLTLQATAHVAVSDRLWQPAGAVKAEAPHQDD